MVVDTGKAHVYQDIHPKCVPGICWAYPDLGPTLGSAQEGPRQAGARTEVVTRWGGCEILRSGGSAWRGALQDPIILCRAVLGQREQSEGREPWGTQEKTDL